MKLILPKTKAELRDYEDLPLFFLGGPIRGGGDWQERMARLLNDRFDGECLIAIPCRYDYSHPLYQYRLFGADNVFERQKLWERHYLYQGGIAWPKGCIIFWLAAESPVTPRLGPEPYAMETRGEVGEWRGRAMSQHGVRIVMGADSTFPGLEQIRVDNEDALPRKLTIFDTMKDVVSMAVHVCTDPAYQS